MRNVIINRISAYYGIFICIRKAEERSHRMRNVKHIVFYVETAVRKIPAFSLYIERIFFYSARSVTNSAD